MARLFEGIERFNSAPALIDPSGLVMSHEQLASLADKTVETLGSQRLLVVIEAENAIEPLAFMVGATRAGHAIIPAAPASALVSRIERDFPVGAIYRRGQSGVWQLELSHIKPPALHEDLAVLLSTSGSTGSPKLVKLSHYNLIANAQSISEYLELTHGEKAITSLPPYYSYGLSVITSHLTAGHALVLNSHSIADKAFWDTFNAHECTSFAGVPHSFELLERTGFFSADLPSLRYFTQAGGRLQPSEVRRFAEFASARGKRFYVMYGQTEASPRMAWLPPELASAHPDCIGVPVPGGSFRISPADEGQGDRIGELVYSGPNVMMGYATAQADLAKPKEVYELATGDIGEQINEGLFRIVGRKSRFIKLYGARFALDDVEARLATAGHAAVATGDDQGLVVATCSAGSAAAIQDTLPSMLSLPVSAIQVIVVEEMPRLSNGKVDYGALLRLRVPDAPMPKQDLRHQIAAMLGVASIRGDENFISLGGDSLNYIQASLIVEKHLGKLPEGWESMPISRLEAVSDTSGAATSGQSVDASVIIRAAAILLVVFHHASGFDMAGAAFALLAVAGYNFARFQVPKLSTGSVLHSIKATALRVWLPYLAFLGLFFVYLNEISLMHLALYSNFTTGFFFDGERRLEVYWFIETYLVIYLLFSLVFLSPVLRRSAIRSPRIFAYALLALSILIRAIGEVYYQGSLTLTAGGEVLVVGRPSFFFKNTAPMLAYVFVLGWVIHQAQSIRERLVLAALGVALVYALPPAHVEVGRLTFLAFMLLLIFASRVRVGRVANLTFTTLASGSLYIYMSHPLILRPVRMVLGEPVPLAWIGPVVVLCVVVGVALWRMTQELEGRSRRLRAAA